jgi:hypothetical protein
LKKWEKIRNLRLTFGGSHQLGLVELAASGDFDREAQRL